MYLIAVDFEQTSCVYVVVGRGSGVALQILILLKFLKIAERRRFLLRRRRVIYKQHVMVIGRNKRSVKRSVVNIVRCTVAHCCENVAFLIKKFNLPMRVFSFKFLNCAMRHN